MKTNDPLESIRELCRICADECTTCAVHCREMPGMEICVELCEAASVRCREVVMHARPSDDMLRTCADACHRCADVCSKIDDIHCQSCADMCAKCEEACSDAVINRGTVVPGRR